VTAMRDRGGRRPPHQRPTHEKPPLNRLAAAEAWAKAPPVTGADTSHLPDFWGRACQLLVCLILLLIPCLYPLRLPDRTIEWLRGQSGKWWHHFYLEQLDVFVNYGYSPLPLKEGAFSVLVVLLVLCWYTRQVGRAWSVSPRGEQRFDWPLYLPIFALLIWSAISLLCTPTFYWSLTTYALVAAGLLWFIVVYEMPKSPRLVRRWFNTVLLAGGIVAFFAFLQDADRGQVITGLLFGDFEEATQRDPRFLRQRIGSLIGHNIGVASLITFSWFILLSRLFRPVAWNRKIGWAALMLLLLYVIAASQTRGVWIVLAILTPCHLAWLIRLTGKRWDLRPVLGVILIILIILTLQTIPSPRNPFYSPESPLLVRFTHFSPRHLMTETRLRIAVCSASLVADRPVRGHGLGSFQYVFAPAQADYFARNPDSVLTPGSYRTMRAHGDWLQVLIELGLPGLLIVVAGLYVALRRGWAGWLRLRDPTFRTEMTAPLMGVAGVMIHALADFPIHVVSTTANAVFFLAVWTGCGQIGRREDRPTVSPSGRSALSSGDQQVRLAATASLILLVPAAIGATAWFYSLLHASMYESLGTSIRLAYGERYEEMDDSERRFILGTAYAVLKKGQKVAPLDRQITYRLGEVAMLQGVLSFLEAEKARALDEPSTKVAALCLEAESQLRRAISWLEMCQNEVRFHEVFHYLGMAHEHLHRLRGSEEHRQRAKQYYRQAVRYSPSFSRSSYRLFLMLQKDRPPNAAEMRQVCRQIAQYDPPLFQRQFTQPVVEAIERRDFRQAAMKIDVLIEVQPGQSHLWLTKIHLLSYAGRSAEAQMLLEDFRAAFPDFPAPLLLAPRMEVAAAAGRYEETVNLATAALAIPGSEGIAPHFRCVRAAALEKLGRPEAKDEWSEIERLGDTDRRYLIAAADAFLFLVHDQDRAYEFLLKLCRSELPTPASLLRIAAEMALRRGEEELGVDFLERALELDPEDQLTGELLRSLPK